MTDTPKQVVPVLGFNREVIGTATIRPVDDKGRVYADVIIDSDKVEAFIVKNPKEKND